MGHPVESTLTSCISECWFLYITFVNHHKVTCMIQDTNSTGINDIFDVIDKLGPVTHRWKQVGLALRLDPNKLYVIEKENKQLEDCLDKALTLWLKMCYNTERFGDPSWLLLAKAVDHPAGGNNRALAEIIRGKGGICPSVYQYMYAL